MTRNMNLREMFSKYPLGCESFGAEWLRRWEEIGRLLEAPARIEAWRPGQARWIQSFGDFGNNTVASAISIFSNEDTRRGLSYRIVLLDGTIVKEWGVT